MDMKNIAVLIGFSIIGIASFIIGYILIYPIAYKNGYSAFKQFSKEFGDFL